MTPSAKAVLQHALKLPPNDRAALVEALIRSLDRPDPTLNAQWLKEAEERLAAYRSGELAATDAEQVFAELGAAWDDLADKRELELADGTAEGVPLDVAVARLEARDRG